MMTNRDYLKRLDAAYKGLININSLGDSVLQPVKFEKFIQSLQEKSKILPEARFIEMDAQQVDIDRVGFTGRILRSGEKRTGLDKEHRELTPAEYAEPEFKTNKLIAQELQAVAGIRDKALRRNIEKGGFEETLLSMFGEAAGRDFEEFALFADTKIPYADDDVLHWTDGWLRKAANKLYGRSWGVGGLGVGDFDVNANDYPENVFSLMLLTLPKKYLQDETEWRFYCPYSVINAYRKLLKKRNTNLGDEATTAKLELTFEGIPLVYVPIMERAKPVNLANENNVKRDRIEGKAVLLAHPDNLTWGVFHEVTIEKERHAVDRRTDFVLTFEGDAHYEDENGAVVALIDKVRPT